MVRALRRWLKPNSLSLRSASLYPILFCLSVAFLAAPQTALAVGEYRWGFSFGYGGIGVSTVATDTTSAADRSEGPLVTSLFVDKLLSDTFAIGFEHQRGVSLAPFSSGASLTGLTARWYFFGPAPSATAPTQGGTSIFIKRYIPFAAVTAGVAQASLERDNDVNPVVSGAGTYLGFKFGADYPTAPGSGLRPEFSYASTGFTQSFSSAIAPPTLTQFSVGCSWYYYY
jgi:hypothetical protein